MNAKLECAMICAVNELLCFVFSVRLSNNFLLLCNIIYTFFFCKIQIYKANIHRNYIIYNINQTLSHIVLITIQAFIFYII